MKKLFFILLIVLIPVGVWGQVTKTVGEGADYPTLTAAFNAINDGSITGEITLQITSSINEEFYDEGELTYVPTSAVLYQSGYTGSGGTSNYTSILIYPTDTGFEILGYIDAPVIEFNGADNVSIKGGVNQASSIDLAIANINTGSSASTIRFTESAEDNLIQYCTIKGSIQNTSSGGIIELLTASSSASGGNNTNTIEYNNITVYDDDYRPTYLIYSSGTEGKENSSNVISNNNIYNFFNPSSTSYSIYLGANNTSASVTSNSFYDTETFSPGINYLYNVIYISNSGAGYTISGNYIGGSATLCGGTPWTKTGNNNSFNAIYLSTGSGTTNSIQNNTVQNFSWSNSVGADWTGIKISNGNANVGTTSGNTIGNSTGTGSVTVTNGGSLTYYTIFGIYIETPGTINCQNNTFGSITATTTNTKYASNIYCIYLHSTAGTVGVNNNLIGSSSTTNSILTSASTRAQNIFGIYNTSAGSVTISGNIINNITNLSTTSSNVIAIYLASTSSGTNIVTSNFIHSLSVIGGSLFGIRIYRGATNCINNIITIGNDNVNTIYGIYETGLTSVANNLYFNTVYIGGIPATGTNLSYALYSNTTETIRNFRNNILVNARSRTGSTNQHYALYLNYSTSTNLTLDYNNYYVSGTGGVLGSYAGSNVSALPIVTGKDVSSLNLNPSFAEAGGVDAIDYIPSNTSLVAATGTGILTDYDGTTRSTSFPAMGAHEYSITALYWKWTGATDSDWGTTTNWNYNLLPSSSAIVTIPDVTNEPEVDELPGEPAICSSLTINTGSSLTVLPARALTISGTLTNNGTLNLNSTSAGTASLKLGSYSDNGTENIQLYLTGDGTGTLYHYISPPVTSASTSLFSDVSVRNVTAYYENLITTDMHNGWVNYEGYHYNTMSDPDAWDATPSQSSWPSLLAGRGYNYYSSSNRTFTFSGAINTANIGTSIQFNSASGTEYPGSQGFNLLGNPFTCAIDWDLVTADASNEDIWSNVGQTVYFRKNGVVYYYNNGTTLPYEPTDPGYIPPMQGFFVKASASGETLTIPSAAKVHTVNERYKGSAASFPQIRLLIEGSGSSDATVVRFDEKATLAFDNIFDAYKFYPSAGLSGIASVLEATNFAINTIPLPEGSVTIPLTVVTPSMGSFTVSASDLSGLSGYNVTLHDKTGNAFVDLHSTNTYNFLSPAGKITDRFEITISSNLTSISEKNTSDMDFRVFAGNGLLNVQPMDETWNGVKGDIKIIDLTGRSLMHSKNNEFHQGHIIQLPVAAIANGVYIIEISSGIRRYIGKVFFR